MPDDLMESSPPSGLSHRLPPSNVRAEQALLGAILANNRTYERVAEFLLPEHFADPLHGRIYQAIARRIEAGQLADAVTLKAEFEHAGVLDEVGGVAYLGQLLGAMVHNDSAAYGLAIFEAWQRRRIIETAREAIEQAFDGERPPREAAASIAAMFDQISDATAGRAGVMLHDAVDRAIAAGERARDASGCPGIATGFRAIDAAIGGFEAGGLYVIAGRPGMGKTALGLQLAVTAASNGVNVIFISLEMQAAQIGRRILALEAGVPLQHLRSGTWSQDEASRIVIARQKLHDVPLTIEDEGSATVSAIAARVRNAARRRGGIGLLIIDHLHLVDAPPTAQRAGPTEAVSAVSRGLKGLAQRAKIPVLALAQLNRGVEGREDKRPQLSDLRQSGAIEQDAEAVMLLYRAEYYFQRSPPERLPGEGSDRHAARVADWTSQRDQLAGRAEVSMPKVRDGEPTTVVLHFDGSRTAFLELENN